MKPEEEFSQHVDHFVRTVAISDATGLRAAIECSELLSKLYYLGFQLPMAEMDVHTFQDIPKIELSEMKRVQEFAGRLPFTYYTEALDPLILDPQDHSVGDLADDLCDIYQDVVGANRLFFPNQSNSAVWHWNYHMRIHWGRHVTSALHALQCYIQNNLNARTSRVD